MSSHRSGFVSLIGRPNAGKSTLLNALIGSKLAIVADKPQTTRTIIQGVLTTPEAQVVFLDTPGIHEPRNLLHRRMIETIRQAMEGRDLILFVVDSTHNFGSHDEQALAWISETKTPVLLVLNKVDALSNKASLLPLLEQYRNRYDFAAYIPISALQEDLGPLRNEILQRLPEGPRYFPDDYLTDLPEKFLAAELIREKILNATREEVPHSVAVAVEQWKEEPRKDGTVLTRILATIHVEREGQKRILIGQGGSMLKQIGTEARLEIEKLLERKVFLEMFVRVTEDWRERAQFLNELDRLALSKED
jgi:GTP-binding protein Era